MAGEGDSIASLLSENSKPDEKLEQLFQDETSKDQKAEEITPEDAAWADSCFVGGPELSDDSWRAMREALLDALSAKVDAFETPTWTDADEMQQESRECVQVLEEALAEDTESRDKIFRVWDLETPEEEDELIKQLKKVLAESRIEVVRPSLGGHSATLKEGKLDELITGISDMSLRPPSKLKGRV